MGLMHVDDDEREPEERSMFMNRENYVDDREEHSMFMSRDDDYDDDRSMFMSDD